MNLLDTLQISASGLAAERVRLQSVASNLANARTTRSADGSGPYQRRAPVFEAQSLETFGTAFDRELSQVRVTDIEIGRSEGRLVHDPGHPDADAAGYVTLPNVDSVTEMVDMITASRGYEANVQAATRDLALRALEIGK
jgi:flagellar basal-body rod protein FlgC